MKAVIESTTKIVTLIVDGHEVPARIWEGVSEGGVPFHCYITRVAVHESVDPAQFQAELLEQRPPTVEIAAIPGRLVI